ncbi:hypothetical protein SLE2022_170060 [Rubroshorea leprosula]
MASLTAFVFLSILLLLHPTTSMGSYPSSHLASPDEELCKGVACGKGKCKPSQNSTFPFECQCDAGWKQTRADTDDHLKFLPCVIPNSAPAPVQVEGTHANSSVLDPCHWADCGGGSCNKTSIFTYNCVCAEGFYNLLNVSGFPCFQKCATGHDCASLGISMANKSRASAPALAVNGNRLIAKVRLIGALKPCIESFS